MLRILGRRNSSNVQKVMWCIGELGLEYEREDFGGAFGGTDLPDYLARNPNALVPTMEEDGFVLWESNAIVRYIAAKYDSDGLYPADLRTRMSAERWMDWQLGTVNLPMWPLFYNLVRVAPDARDGEAVARARNEAIKYFRILDDGLADRDYLVGDRLTIADIPLGVMAYRFFTLPIARPSLPRAEAWYRRLAARQAYRAHVMLPLD
jgi:glutathione S-transferase